MSIDDKLHWLVARYMASPQWFKHVIGGSYALLPRPFRHGPSYRHYRKVLSATSADPQYVRSSLALTVQTALRSVPAFGEHRHLLADAERHPSDVLRLLPFMEKADIKKDLGAFLSRAKPKRDRLKMFTGGSTSIPMTFYGQVGVSRAKELAAFDAMADRFGTEGDGVILALRGRTVPTAGTGRMWMYEPIKRQLVLSSDHLEPRFMKQYVEALQRWRPRYIQAFPSALYPLITWLRENGFESTLAHVRCVTLVSESVFQHHLTAFRQFFQCPVLVTYGHTERVLLANTLPDDSRYHFWPHYGYFELIDPEGRPVTQPGRVGEIVGTSFDNLVMPFVRYRTGDYAVLGESPHPLMAGSPVVDRIEGRLQEFVVCADHRLVTVTTIGAAHVQELERCLRIQYEQFEPGRLILRVVSVQPLDVDVKARVCRAIEQKTQGGCRVEVQEVDRIELTSRGKQRLLVQHLDVGRFLGAALSTATEPSGVPIVEGATATAAPLPSCHGPGPDQFASLADTLGAGRVLLMIGTSGKTQGGIASVVNTYRNGGLFDRVPSQYVVSHCDGSALRKAMQFVSALAETVGALSRRRVALVHAHVSSGSSFWRKSILLLAARLGGVPTVFHLHSGGFSKWVERIGPGSLGAGWIRHTIESSSKVIALNRGTSNWLATFAPQANVTVMGNPIVVPSLNVKAPEHPARAGGRVLYLGWIYDFKGCYDLLRAWAKFRQKCPGWRLSVGGKGEVDRFLAEAEELGVRGDIDFLGWVTGPEKEEQFRQADVLILPSYHEGMPMSVLEGMAHGIAIAATPVGGVAEMMVPNVHGLWMKPGDIDGICACLVTLAESPDLRARMGRAGHDHVKANNSIESILEQLLSVYRDVLDTASAVHARGR